MANGPGAQTPHEQWLQSVAQLQELGTATLQQYVLGMNAELSGRAGYKALGLDPRDFPAFGWGNLMSPQHPGQSTVVLNPPSPPVIQRWEGNWFWKAVVLVLLALVLIAAGGVGVWFLASPSVKSQAAAPAPPASPGQDFDVILERDGKEISRAPIPAK